jgi:hypothetical protein
MVNFGSMSPVQKKHFELGVLHGEKRLARALQQMIRPLDVDDPITKLALQIWLSARLKRERK